MVQLLISFVSMICKKKTKQKKHHPSDTPTTFGILLSSAHLDFLVLNCKYLRTRCTEISLDINLFWYYHSLYTSMFYIGFTVNAKLIKKKN